MTLREYIDGLNAFLEDHPEAADFTVVTAKDSEGNGYDEVYYSPSIGQLDSDGDFIHLEGLEDDDEELNAVCVN